MNKDNLRKISVILLAGLIILGGWNMLTTGAKSKDLDPNAIYLSDIKPESQRVGWDRYRVDQPLVENAKEDYQQITVNHPVSLKPQSYPKGIFAHADAELIYDLGKPNAEGKTLFRAFAGIQANKSQGRLKFDFYLDGDFVATTESIGHFQTKPIVLDIKNRKRLKIKIDHLGEKTQDHAVLADAKFVAGDLKDMISQAELERRVNAQFNLATAPHDQTSRLTMLQAQLLRRVGVMDYYYFVKTDGNQAFNDWFFNDIDALAMSNEAEKPYGTGLGFLSILKSLDDYDPTIRTDSLNKKIAIAVATAFSGKVRFWADWAQEVNHISRYRMFRNLSRVKGELRPIFNELDTAYMTTVVKAEATDEDILWLREKIKKEHPDLLKSNSDLSNATYRYIRYTDKNRFGDSIHGANFYGFFPSLAEVIEHGGVCGTVSKFDSVALNAFGVPGILVGQPGHAAVIYFDDNHNWQGNNWISSWGETSGNPYSATIRDANYESSFSHIVADSLKQPHYDRARELYDHTHYLTDHQTKRATLRQVIELNPLFLPAYQSLFELYQARNASEYHYVELAHLMMENLYRHPVPMTKRLEPIKAKITSRKGLNEYYAKYIEAMGKAQRLPGVSSDSISPQHHRQKITEARNYLGKFSLSDEHANQIVGGQTDTEYSLDNGQTWSPIKNAHHQLTSAEINSINLQYGLKLRVRGSRYPLTINFKKAQTPSLRINDQENYIIGINDTMEYSYDNGRTWMDYEAIQPNLAGNVRIQVRVKGSGTTYASDPVELAFTDNQLDNNFDFVFKQNLRIKHATSQMSEHNEGAKNLIDGDINTIWHSSYNRGDTQPTIVIELNKSYPVTGLQYVPRQNGADNGRALQVEVAYYNGNIDTTDGKTILETPFTPIGNQPIEMNYQGNIRQAVNINFSKPVEARYVKFKIIKGSNHFGAGAELRIRTTREATEKAAQQLAQDTINANLERLRQSVTDNFLPKYQILKNKIKQAQDEAELASMIAWLGDLDKNLTGANDQKVEQLSAKLREFEQRYHQLSDEFAKRQTLAGDPVAPASAFEAEDNELVDQFRRDFKDELTTISHDYHRLARAYYNLMALPVSVINKLSTEKTNLTKKLQTLDQDQASVQLYRQQFAEVINSQDVAVANRQLHHAKQALKLLPRTARDWLMDEQGKLRALEKKMKADGANSKLILTKMVADSKDFIDRLEDAEYQESTALSNLIQTAETALAEGRAREAYDQLSYDLMMRVNDLKFKIKNQVLIERRVQDFRNQHQAILNKDLTTINDQDKKARERADWMYTRLGATAQKVAEADMRQINLIKEITNQTDHSELAVATTALKGLINNAKVDQDKLHYSSLRQELQTMLAQVENNPSAVDIKATAQTLQVAIAKIKQRDTDAQQYEAQTRYQYRSLFRRVPADIPVGHKDQIKALLAEVRQKAQELKVGFSNMEQSLEAMLTSIENRLAPVQTQPPVVTPPTPAQPTKPVEKPTEEQNQPAQPSVEKKPDTTTPQQPGTSQDLAQAGDKSDKSQPSTSAQPSTPAQPVDKPQSTYDTKTPESTPEKQSEAVKPTPAQPSTTQPSGSKPSETTNKKPEVKPHLQSKKPTHSTVQPPASDTKPSAETKPSVAPQTGQSTVRQLQPSVSPKATPSPAPVAPAPIALNLQQTSPSIKQQIRGSINNQSNQPTINPLGDVERPQATTTPAQDKATVEQATPQSSVTVREYSAQSNNQHTTQQSHDNGNQTKYLSPTTWFAIIGGGTVVTGAGWWIIAARRRRQ